MIYADAGSLSAMENFGCEMYFATEARLTDTVFLLWSTVPTVMLGKYQNALEEIDRNYVEAHGITVIRRMSGGGTIYTDPGGLQFSYIVPDGAAEIDFTAFVTPVTRALCAMGLDAAADGRNDILVSGKKVSGNAQYKIKGTTVHHGSLLFDTDLAALTKATTPKPYKITSKSIASVRDRVTNIREHLPHDMNLAAFRGALLLALVGNTTPYPLTDAVRERIHALGMEYYGASVWETGPKYEITKVCHLSGGTMEFSLSVKNGTITACRVSGDFFASVDGGEIEACLTGQPLAFSALENALSPLSGRLFSITPAEIARVLSE